MQKTSLIRSVGTIVVTYNPDSETLLLQLSRLKSQVEKIYIVDNGSQNAHEVVNAASKVESTTIHLCDDNYGLGRAHNIGIQACRDAGHDAVLILDQDTIPHEHMVSTLVKSLDHLSQTSPRTSAVGSRYIGASGQSSFFVQFSGFRFQKHYCAKSKFNDVIPADMLISSGSLIPMNAIDAIGNMDEALFIDHIDTEWFLRAKSAGWQAFGVCDAVMEHHLGESTLHVWWGRWRSLPIHSAFRYYYIYRNSILLYQRRYVNHAWRRADIIRLILMAFILPLSSKQTLKCFRMIFLGIIHGLNGKTGPLS